ncbi:UNVERIFIED_CONTAM: hypothetical protein HDU68_009898 [Siphonaria sp. JEL0065]|nr:hypothetical protein HDU68_009898 [Siphonaria sp. JEL0065]
MAKTFGIKSTGVDFSPATIKEAIENAEVSGVSHLCTFMLEDFMLWKNIPTKFTWVSAYVPKTLLGRLRVVVEEWLLAPETEFEPRLFVSVLWKMKGWERRRLVAKDELMTLWVADKVTAVE